LIADGRGPEGDALLPGARLYRPALLAVLFFVTALAVLGLPPLGGFIGKVMLLSATDGPLRLWVWAIVLVASLMTMVGFARAYSTLFWKRDDAAATPPAAAGTAWPAGLLLAVTIAVTVSPAPLERYVQQTARALVNRGDYIHAALTASPVPPPARAAKDQPGVKMP
jgi:multicomponent K+:H+ antiporter subunit D